MKQLLIFFALLLIIRADALSSDGKIITLTPGTFQITYVDQVTNLYFNYLPRGDFEHKVSSEAMFEAEKQIIVRNIRDGIDLLPDDFISEFLGVDVHFLHIQDEETFGYYYDNQIILEVEDSKLLSAGQHSIAFLFMYQLAHRLVERMKNRDEMRTLMDFLDTFYSENYCEDVVAIEDQFRCGYVNSQAAYIRSGNYSAADEFADVFAKLIMPDKRYKILEYVNDHPGSALEDKIEIVVDFIEDIVPAMNRSYFLGDMPFAIRAQVPVDESGEGLLRSHENKSGEGSFNEHPDYVEEVVKDPNKNVDVPTDPIIINETVDDVYTYGLSTEEVEQDLAKREQEIRQKDQTRKSQQHQKKKKKRRKAIIWSTVALVLLAFI